MRLLVVLFMCFLVAILISGCGTNTHVEKEDTGKESTKELVVAVKQANSTFDPFAPHNRFDVFGRKQVYDTLLSKNENGDIVTSLAEKYEISADAQTYTFWLRKGVMFSNGDEFKATDAKHSIELAMEAPSTMSYFSGIESIDVIDDYTIKVNMKAPDVTLPETLVSFGLMVNAEVAKKYGDQLGTSVENTVGTGPYILKEWQSGQLCVFEANPNYFKGEPDIKKVRFKAISDPNATVIAIQTGEVQLHLGSVPTTYVSSIEKDVNLNLVPIMPERLFYFFMNNEDGPLTDIRLRRAISYAIDREQLNAVAADGLGTIADYLGLPSYSGNPNIITDSPWIYTTDIDAARQLVKEAGMEGEKLTISLENTDPLPILATSIQEQLSKIGIDVEVQILETNAFLADVCTGGKFEIGVSFNTARTQDMDTVWTFLLSSANIGVSNSSRYSNPKLDELIIKARGEIDPEARQQLYAEAIEIVHKDVPVLALFYEPSNRVYSKDITVDPGLINYDMIFDYKWNR